MQQEQTGAYGLAAWGVDASVPANAKAEYEKRG